MKFESLVWELNYSDDAWERVIAFARSTDSHFTEHESKKYADSLHCHLKRLKQKGVVELTLWPAKQRFWMSVRSNRQGEWTTETVEQLIGMFGISRKVD